MKSYAHFHDLEIGDIIQPIGGWPEEQKRLGNVEGKTSNEVTINFGNGLYTYSQAQWDYSYSLAYTINTEEEK